MFVRLYNCRGRGVCTAKIKQGPEAARSASSMAMLRLPTRTLYGSALTGKENIGMVHWYNSIFRLLSMYVYIYTGDYMCLMWFVCWYMLTRAQKLQDVKHWPFKIGQLRFIREEYDDWDDRYDDVDDYFDAGICHRRCGCVSKFAGNC